PARTTVTPGVSRSMSESMTFCAARMSSAVMTETDVPVTPSACSVRVAETTSWLSGLTGSSSAKAPGAATSPKLATVDNRIKRRGDIPDLPEHSVTLWQGSTRGPSTAEARQTTALPPAAGAATLTGDVAVPEEPVAHRSSRQHARRRQSAGLLASGSVRRLRLPGSRFPVFQWHHEGALAGYSCGDSRGFKAKPVHHIPF